MARTLVVADDFTGAMDTGDGFAARGCSVRVRLGSPESGGTDGSTADGSDALVVDLDTRAVDPDAAATAVADACADAPPLVYKKLDSTLRGHVVAEVDAAVDAIDADLAVVAPAFPATGRVTANGLHLVDGVPLAEAGYGATTSTLSARFDASRYRVAPLEIETVASGAAAVRSALSSHCEGDPTVVTCDAIHERHLEAIAAGAQSLEATVLLAGSGGLATAVSVPGVETGAQQPNARPGPQPESETPSGGTLAVVGSVNDRTLAQLEAVPDDELVRLDPAAAVREPERVGREAAAALADRLETHGRVVVTGATAAADIERAESAAATHEGEESVDAGDRIATALATAAAATEAVTPVSGLCLTGGATARATLEELGASAIDLSGESVEDGIPMGRLADGPTAGLRVATKAGGFGSARSIVNCLNSLESDNDSPRG